MRLSELKEGDRIITYAYDKAGRLSEKTLPNGLETHYTYDSKSQLKELIHIDPQGIMDRYEYQYDLLGNKVAIQKERRGLESESGKYAYDYDALGRLEQVSKDGQMLRKYQYDAFGNRIQKEEGTATITYCHNAVNQLIAEVDDKEKTVIKTYEYDKRGNLSQIVERGKVQNQYLYGAQNRLEQAVNREGEVSRYTYNGLGYRIEKQTGRNTEANQIRVIEQDLNPRNRLKEIGFQPKEKVCYTIDLTKAYHNLLMKENEGRTQSYFWDGNVAAYEEGGHRSYYLSDELGSPVRIMDEAGALQERYGYGEFGEDLYGNQGKTQAFGYTGYQRDEIAGTYFAQAREYRPEIGRYVGEDIVRGIIEYPYTLNHYTYCWNQPLKYVDYDGEFPTIVIGAAFGFVAGAASSTISQIISGKKVDLKEVILDAAGGAVKGAIAGSGVGLIAGAVTTGATAATTNVAKQMVVEKKSLEKVDWASAGIDGVVDGVTYGYSRYKIDKQIKIKGKTTHSELLDTDKQLRKVEWDKASNYPSKRQNGKSYARKIAKINNLKEVKGKLQKKWIKELTKKMPKDMLESVGVGMIAEAIKHPEANTLKYLNNIFDELQKNNEVYSVKALTSDCVA